MNHISHISHCLGLLWKYHRKKEERMYFLVLGPSDYLQQPESPLVVEPLYGHPEPDDHWVSVVVP